MKKTLKWRLSCLLLGLTLLLSGCSYSGNKNASNKSSDAVVSSDHSRAGAVESQNSKSQASTNSSSASKSSSQGTSETTTLPDVQNHRMIIYNAQLTVTVKNIAAFQKEIEDTMKEYHGYMVQMTQNQGAEKKQATLTLRIPQQDFYTFINLIEKKAGSVDHKRITGEDVTKQYVDFQSRLKAKELVESRLTSFLKKATKTEDLLSISNQLGTVQEEIETIKGQMKYLKNQSDLSTININVLEKAPTKIDTTHLNTWQKTKGMFKSSINGLTSFFSWLVIVLIGYSPVWIILLIIGLAIYFYLKKRKNKE